MAVRLSRQDHRLFASASYRIHPLHTAGVLVNGVGMSLNGVTCELGIFLCIGFYALSKVCLALSRGFRINATLPLRSLYTFS